MVSALECVIRTAHSTRAATPKLENRLWMLQVELLAGFLPY
jgi:hypothetical protein